MATQQAEEDEALVDIPDDYLDPIMGCIMKDPVLLPSSGKIVDRQTIARHILRSVITLRSHNNSNSLIVPYRFGLPLSMLHMTVLDPYYFDEISSTGERNCVL